MPQGGLLCCDVQEAADLVIAGFGPIFKQLVYVHLFLKIQDRHFSDGLNAHAPDDLFHFFVDGIGRRIVIFIQIVFTAGVGMDGSKHGFI